MLKRILIISAIFSSLASYYPDHAQAQNVTVPFEFRANLIAVKINVNGISKIFVLDTGASKTVIDKKTAETLGLNVIGEAKVKLIGREVDALLVQVDSIGIDGLVRHDLQCGATNFDEGIKQMLGSDISGFLGFDFVSEFKVSIDYCDQMITFDRCNSVVDTTVCAGDSAIVPDFGIVRMPNDFWECTTETPMRQILAAFYNTKYSGLAATLQIQDHEIKGIASLESIVSSFELQLKSQIKNFEKLSGQASKLGDKEIYVLEYKGYEEGIALKFKHIFIMVKENFFSIICYAPVERFDSLRQDFDELITNIQFEE